MLKYVHVINQPKQGDFMVNTLYASRKDVNPKWSEYDKVVGYAQLSNPGLKGKIYLDEYGCPIDDDYILEQIEKEMEVQ